MYLKTDYIENILDFYGLYNEFTRIDLDGNFSLIKFNGVICSEINGKVVDAGVIYIEKNYNDYINKNGIVACQNLICKNIHGYDFNGNIDFEKSNSIDELLNKFDNAFNIKLCTLKILDEIKNGLSDIEVKDKYGFDSFNINKNKIKKYI